MPRRAEAFRGCLFTLLRELSALFAKRLSARPLSPVFSFEVPAGLALCIVVVNHLFNRMPRRTHRHGLSLPSWSDLVNLSMCREAGESLTAPMACGE
jgi:hypothetical protein